MRDTRMGGITFLIPDNIYCKLILLAELSRVKIINYIISEETIAYIREILVK